MSRTISLREANQGFARCVREVEAGAMFIITRNGAPVAQFIPANGPFLSPAQAAALARTQARMQRGWSLGSPPLDRDALHER